MYEIVHYVIKLANQRLELEFKQIEVCTAACLQGAGCLVSARNYLSIIWIYRNIIQN